MVRNLEPEEKARLKAQRKEKKENRGKFLKDNSMKISSFDLKHKRKLQKLRGLTVKCAACLALRRQREARKLRAQEKARELLGSSSSEESSEEEEAFVKSLSKAPKQKELQPIEEKPAVMAPTVNYYKGSRKNYTTSIVIPSSIVDNA